MNAIASRSGPEVWTGDDLRCDQSWSVALTPTHLAEIEAAVQASAAIPVEAIAQIDFPLPSLGPVLEDVLHQLIDGRGMVRLRGLPVAAWPREKSIRAYWGLGTWLGDAVSQNAAGHLIGHVADLRQPDRPERRLYQTNKALSFHTDSCDLVGLLCLQTGRAGGDSLVASSAAVHNRLLQTDPAALAVLHETFHCDRYGEIPAGKDASYVVRVFNPMGRHLTCCGMDPDIRSAQRLPEVPRLTRAQLDALDALQAAALAVALPMTLASGDIQLLHNHVALHARAAFEDYDEPHRRRHLLRLWLSARNGRPLPEFLAERWGNIAVGQKRGGIVVPGQKTSVPLAPAP